MMPDGGTHIVAITFSQSCESFRPFGYWQSDLHTSVRHIIMAALKGDGISIGERWTQVEGRYAV